MRIKKVLALAALVGASAAIAQVPDAYYDLSGPAFVIDGDTIELEGQRVRLFGLDAPEGRQPCYDADGAPWACGSSASDYLRALVQDKPVRCHSRDRDRYGRVVAQCWVGSVDVAAQLVLHGLAVAYRRYASDYIPAEQQARNRRVGIWSGAFEMPWDWRRGQKGF